MGDEQRLSADEQLAYAREEFDAGRDFTLAVEEEFALLDPETLDLSNRFEELHAAAQGTVLEEFLVGELVSAEVEVRTGKCESFASAPACTRRGRRCSRAPFRGAASRTRSAAGTSTNATCAFCTRPARSSSTRRSGGACGRISRFRPLRCASATGNRRSPRRRRSPRSCTR